MTRATIRRTSNGLIATWQPAYRGYAKRPGVCDWRAIRRCIALVFGAILVWRFL